MGQDIQVIFFKMNQMKHVFSMIWLTEMLTIYLGERLPKKYYVIKHSVLPKIQELNGYQRELDLMVYKLLNKNQVVVKVTTNQELANELLK